MEDFGTDVQSLLQDISSNYGQVEHQQSPLSCSRPSSNSYQHRAERLFDPRQTPASTYGQHSLYATQASRPLEPYSYPTQVLHSNIGLDAYAQHPLYVTQASEPQEPYSYTTQMPPSNADLDANGKCMLPEQKEGLSNECPARVLLAVTRPQPQSQWQTGSAMSVSPPRRISLSGHTAPALFQEGTSGQRLPQPKPRG